MAGTRSEEEELAIRVTLEELRVTDIKDLYYVWLFWNIAEKIPDMLYMITPPPGIDPQTLHDNRDHLWSRLPTSIGAQCMLPQCHFCGEKDHRVENCMSAQRCVEDGQTIRDHVGRFYLPDGSAIKCMPGLPTIAGLAYGNKFRVRLEKWRIQLYMDWQKRQAYTGATTFSFVPHSEVSYTPYDTTQPEEPADDFLVDSEQE